MKNPCNVVGTEGFVDESQGLSVAHSASDQVAMNTQAFLIEGICEAIRVLQGVVDRYLDASDGS